MSPRTTRSQEPILQVLKQMDRAISAQDLYVELRNRDHSIGLATVYRALEALKLRGVVQSRTVNGESLYSLVQSDKHYLTCLQCGTSIPLEDCPVHELEATLRQSLPFKITITPWSSSGCVRPANYSWTRLTQENNKTSGCSGSSSW